jgi:hypothetical protein
MNMAANRIWSRQAAIPTEHGSWVFLLVPLVTGLVLGNQWGWPQVFLVIGALAAFLSRQSITLLVKVLSKRRPVSDRAPAIFWLGVYGLIALAAGLALWRQGFSFLIWLVLPAIPVMGWHLWLVSRRQERRKPGVEIVGSAALALAAPAGIWLGHGGMNPQGWWVWLLVVLQNAASIVYAYLRLEQRVLAAKPTRSEKLRMGKRAMLYTSFNLLLVVGLSIAGILPDWLWLAFLVQWGESIFGTIHPAIKVKPARIGIRQTIISTCFTVLFILIWM